MSIQVATAKIDNKDYDALLNAYLDGTEKAMAGAGRAEWKKIAKQSAEKVDLSDFSWDAIEKKSKKLKDSTKEFDAKTKVAHALDVYDEKGSAGVLGMAVFSVVASAAMCVDDNLATGIALAAALASTKVRKEVNAKFAPKSEEEKASLAEYAQIKRSQLALKKLENAILKKECKEATQEAYRKGILPVFPYHGGYIR